MIRVYHTGHSYHYELERLIRMFLAEAVHLEESIPNIPPYIITSIDGSGEEALLSVNINLCGIEKRLSSGNEKNESLEMAISRLLYKGICELTGEPLRWGLLTGVRPVKLARSLVDGGMSPDTAKNHLMENYLLSDQAASLTMEVLSVQRRVVPLTQPNEFGLYISVPFCPTRCSYCSFVSHSIDKAAKLIPDYVEVLCAEIKSISEIAKRRGLKLTSVYMGGGTPTTLSAEQLKKVMLEISSGFNMSFVREYTVEAGRPDTITREKLIAIKNGGADRVSINPQTLSDEILASIGRIHTKSQFFDAFYLARDVGFGCINTDLIAGLPGDTVEGFASSVANLLMLRPENITVHTLTLKRAANMGGEPLSIASTAAPMVKRMISGAKSAIKHASYEPYYLYRQQNTIGGFENVGYSLPGYEGIYNILMMEETGSVISAGAGGVTRLMSPNGKMERIFSLKYPYEYISRPQRCDEKGAKIDKYYENNLPG